MEDKPTIPARPATPPVQDSPAFQKQMNTALGGRPSNPTEFQPMQRGSAATADAPQASGAIAPPTVKAKPVSIFDVTPEESKARAQLDQVRSRLGGVINQLNKSVPELDALLTEAADNADFKALAKAQGFDLKKAETFLAALKDAQGEVTA